MAAKLAIFVGIAIIGVVVAQPVTIGFATANVVEGGTGMVCASGNPAGRTITLNYFTMSAGAVSGSDFVPIPPGTLTFSGTTTSTQCITVITLQDNIDEGTECFLVGFDQDNLPAGVTVDPSTAAVCINDVPAVTPPVIQPQFAAYTVGEADVEVIICVQASNAIDEIVVSFTTQNDQAIAGQDYTSVSGFFTFSPTQTLRCVNISITDDSLVEGQECFDFNLAAPVGVTNLQPTTPVCITDNDAPPQQQFRVGFQPSTYTVQENISPNPFQVCVRLLEGQLAMNQFVRVELTLVPGTALEDLDYEQVDPNPQQIEFNPGNENQALCVPVTIRDNTMGEPTEFFLAMISEAGSNVSPVTVDPDTATITILDNDPTTTTTTMVPTETPMTGGPGVGDDPHFAIFLQSGKLLCYTVQGEHGFAFNLISNEKIHMNALFVPDSRRDEVTWIGSLGIVVQNTHFQGSNTTRIRFESKLNEIYINDRVTLEAKNIEAITFRDGKLLVSEGAMAEGFRYPSVRVNLHDLGMSFTVNFTGEHLDMMWNNLEENENSHGLIGQFFRKGVEIDVAKKLLVLPGKDPVPVMRKPVWAYMEHNVPSDQLCWVAMNPGYQGNHLIDGHYLDYVVDNVLSTDFVFECKHKHQKKHY